MSENFIRLFWYCLYLSIMLGVSFKVTYGTLLLKLHPTKTMISLRPDDVQSNKELWIEFVNKTGEMREKDVRILYIATMIIYILRNIFIMGMIIGFLVPWIMS